MQPEDETRYEAVHGLAFFLLTALKTGMDAAIVPEMDMSHMAGKVARKLGGHGK